MRAMLLRGSPRRKAVAGFAAAITVVTSFFVIQGLAGATVTTAPPSKLLAVGPTDPDNGFPTWYKDSNNLNVGLCLDLNNPFCALAGAGVPDETQPVSFPDNFPDETFYQLANSTIDLPNGTTAVLDDNLEGAFANGPVVPGDQVVFGRVRIRITTPSTGHYVITHPYGVDEFDVTTLGTRNINFVEDVGIGAPGDFTGALGSRINPFLRWDTGLVTGPDGASYLGDGATPHAITGSDLATNFFRIDGPDIGGPGINTIQTNLFTMQGRVATNNGVAPTAVTYTRTATTGGFIDAFARSEINQVIQVSGTGVSGTTLKSDATGNYFARVAFSGDPPATVNLTNTSDRPPTTVKVTLTDQVTLTKATYNADTGDMKVAANSSDTAVPPSLTVVGFGVTLVAGNATSTSAPTGSRRPSSRSPRPRVGRTPTADRQRRRLPGGPGGRAGPGHPDRAAGPAGAGSTIRVAERDRVRLGAGRRHSDRDAVNANTSIASFTAPAPRPR